MRHLSILPSPRYLTAYLPGAVLTGIGVALAAAKRAAATLTGATCYGGWVASAKHGAVGRQSQGRTHPGN